MNIHELLSKFKAEDLQVQFTTECLTDVQANLRGAKITLATTAVTPSAIATNTEPVGVLIWIPREKWSKVAREAVFKGKS